MAEIAGLKLIVPSSVSASSGSASISANGVVTFSGIEKLQVDGVFSSTYDNYLIVASSLISVGGNTSFFLALRSSGTTASGSNYTSQRLLANGSSVSGTRFTSLTLAYAGGGITTSAASNGSHTYLYGPALAQPTAMRSISVDNDSGARLFDYASTHSLSTAYDGFEIGDNSAGVTESGKLQIFGLSQ